MMSIRTLPRAEARTGRQLRQLPGSGRVKPEVCQSPSPPLPCLSPGPFPLALTCNFRTTFPRKSSWPLSFRASLKILFWAGLVKGQPPGYSGQSLHSRAQGACERATFLPTICCTHLRSPCRSVSSPSFCLTDSTVSRSLQARGLSKGQRRGP